ncbi:hypothetical protein A6A06_24845 [Streptomyces sp. CB02923]|uniref:hypothetical protein n=1 Tax=Streptomyces sp. CB02923 TaxID=1718985 RepID=UPI00093C7007|nr:hypothetical protein [Streptomyces sp. CB02923]OKH98853.1 hypothetical protein A6A06_24845 [Streptomyces sp. CB02923]
MRGKRAAGVIAVAAAVAGVCGLAAAQAAPQPAGAAGDTPPSAVEDFAYPGAETILREKGVQLVKGDGHILLTECAAKDWKIKVEANKKFDTVEYCFKVTAKKGNLTLQVPDVTGIWTENQVVRAKLTSDGKTKTVETPGGANQVTPVGVADVGSGGKPAVLIELSVND